MITKKPELLNNFHRKILYYENARSALKDVLLNLMKNQKITILLPAFIGYSPKEGSGIFDPILSTGIKYKFYALKEELLIDIADLKKLIVSIKGRIAILLVHYWGYVDPQYEQIIDLCKKNNIVIIEDVAHAFFTEFYNSRMCADADYAIYSLHKMFPIDKGGMLKMKDDSEFVSYSNTETDYDIWSYDIMGISQVRKYNANILENMLEGNEKIELLRPERMFPTCIPQTYPILLKEGIDRYKVYLELNNLGFGVISLYHTLIDAIDDMVYWRSKKISSGILNLPVHQDVSEKELVNMCKGLKRIIGKYTKEIK